jgi:hypothetical protein
MGSIGSLIGEESVKEVAVNGETPMRDIRSDLKERMAGVASRYADAMVDYERQRDDLEKNHTMTIAALDRERAALEQLLAFEDQRDGVGSSEIKRTARLVPLADFMITKVHAHGPMEKDQLRSEASLAGYFADGNGRTFHLTLMNITNAGRLVRLPDGRYAFPERGSSASLFGMDQSEGGESMKTLM